MKEELFQLQYRLRQIDLDLNGEPQNVDRLRDNLIEVADILADLIVEIREIRDTFQKIPHLPPRWTG